MRFYFSKLRVNLQAFLFTFYKNFIFSSFLRQAR